jgi:hypothetical protein
VFIGPLKELCDAIFTFDVGTDPVGFVVWVLDGITSKDAVSSELPYPEFAVGSTSFCNDIFRCK